MRTPIPPVSGVLLRARFSRTSLRSDWLNCFAATRDHTGIPTDTPEFGKFGQKLCGCLCGCRLVPSPGTNISDSQYLIRSRNRNIEAATSFGCIHVDHVCV